MVHKAIHKVKPTEKHLSARLDNVAGMMGDIADWVQHEFPDGNYDVPYLRETVKRIQNFGGNND